MSMKGANSMSQARENQPGQSSNVRAEKLLSDAAHALGHFWGSTRLRVRDVTRAVRARDEQQMAGSAKPQTAQIDTVTQRAEGLADTLSTRVSVAAASTSLFLRRAAARVREDAEDVWVESQTMRQQNAQPRAK
jgi:hypothetical protein